MINKMNCDNVQKEKSALVKGLTLATGAVIGFSLGATLGSTIGTFSAACMDKDIIREDCTRYHPATLFEKTFDYSYLAGRTTMQLIILSTIAYSAATGHGGWD